MIDTKSHLLTLLDWDASQIQQSINLAIELKSDLKSSGPETSRQGRTIAMYFEKPSLRTISTFQIGITQLGGSSIQLDPQSIGLGTREPVEDVARCVGRWADCLVIRCFDQSLVEDFAKFSGIPVINALTDDFHPCQALALGQTIQEHLGALNGKTVTFVGDGNNVANSIGIMCAKLGMHFKLACPNGYEQSAHIISEINNLNKVSGGSYERFDNAQDAVKTTDLIYTDVWASMGQEEEQVERAKIFMPFQVNDELIALAGPNCLVTHCLPAHRGEEITASVMDMAKNVCFDEAENRLHAQKAVMKLLTQK